MRISDWSSDVCSSDLLSTNGLRAVSPLALSALNTGLSDSLSRIHSDTASSSSEKTNGKRQPHASHISAGIAALVRSTTVRLSTNQIGRASCRERVCQYV